MWFSPQENDEGPCSCSEKLCNNPQGRYKFDEAQVQMHFVETIMKKRLDIT